MSEDDDDDLLSDKFNYLDLPRADDFRVANEIDTFNAKVQGAVSYLSDRGHGSLMIAALLHQYAHAIANQRTISKLAPLLALDTAEIIGVARRSELAAVMHEAAVIASTDLASLRKRLSDARKLPRDLEPVDYLEVLGAVAREAETLIRELENVEIEDVDRARCTARIESIQKTMSALMRLYNLEMIGLETSGDPEESVLETDGESAASTDS